MKLDIEKLINEVSKHPQIYNPDNKHFSNKQIRDNIFNTVISKEMNGVRGKTLQRKWEKILNKYADFIRKLSQDDSSEKVLEKFMVWPWTKPMRIFKPYVRKQFQIPKFQPAVQVPEMNPNDLPVNVPPLFPVQFSIHDIPRVASAPRHEYAHPFPLSRPDYPLHVPRFGFPHVTPSLRQEYPHPFQMPGMETLRMLPSPRPEYPMHPMSGFGFSHSPLPAHSAFSVPSRSDAPGTAAASGPAAVDTAALDIASFMRNNFLMTSSGDDASMQVDAPTAQNIASMLGLDQPLSDEELNTDVSVDEEIPTDDESGVGQPAAKKSRQDDDNVGDLNGADTVNKGQSGGDQGKGQSGGGPGNGHSVCGFGNGHSVGGFVNGQRGGGSGNGQSGGSFGNGQSGGGFGNGQSGGGFGNGPSGGSSGNGQSGSSSGSGQRGGGSGNGQSVGGFGNGQSGSGSGNGKSGSGSGNGQSVGGFGNGQSGSGFGNGQSGGSSGNGQSGSSSGSGQRSGGSGNGQSVGGYGNGQSGSGSGNGQSVGSSGSGQRGGGSGSGQRGGGSGNNVDILPDLPQPLPLVERSPSDFTVQEHTFLAWAKTMSTFTAKRQATIKMKISKIMSEAEFEDLDEEFFATEILPFRSIYTSRR